jgi:hypothetical protein
MLIYQNVHAQLNIFIPKRSRNDFLSGLSGAIAP